MAIFDALKNNFSHPSAESLHSEILRQHPTITLTTVYKTLEMLQSIGEIIALDINPERKHYDPHTTPHHHIICEKCKEIVDIYGMNIDIIPPKEIVEKFSVKHYHIDFYGICKNCKT